MELGSFPANLKRLGAPLGGAQTELPIVIRMVQLLFNRECGLSDDPWLAEGFYTLSAI